MAPTSYPRLLLDVGGTRVRLAWKAGPDTPMGRFESGLCRDHDSLARAIEDYLLDHGLSAPAACAIGIANPITGDQVRMTNHPWSFSIAELQRRLGVGRLVVINDFTAIALSLPDLPPGQLRRIGGGEPVAGAPRAVLGPGTGLGVSGLLSAPSGQPVAIAGEGGHATLAAADAEEAALVDRLRQRFGHASAERALSGPGLVNLYDAVASRAGEPPRAITPPEVIDRARGGDAVCRAALDHFCALLGAFAGNLALTLGAVGGVYVAGGIAPRIVEELESSRFRLRFEGKGRFREYLARIPIYVIGSDPSPALLGASRAIDLDSGG